MFCALTFSLSAAIRRIDGIYSDVISRELDNKKVLYDLQRRCQLVQAALINMLLTQEESEKSKIKQSIYRDFQEIDKRIGTLDRTAARSETRKLVLAVTDSLLIYRRACATFLILVDENNISEASVFLRFNVHQSFSAATAALADIPERLDRHLQIQSNQISTTYTAAANIIRNAGSIPILFWLGAGIILLAMYWEIPFAWFRK